MKTPFCQPCDCVGDELYEKKGREGRPPWPNGLHDEDGYALCGWCGKIKLLPWANGRTQLSRCPDCSRWYKGYKRWPKLNLPCPDCDG